MADRNEKIRMLTVLIGTAIVLASILPDVLASILPDVVGYGGRGFSLLQGFWLATGIFVVACGWLVHRLPARLLLAVGASLFAIDLGLLVDEVTGFNFRARIDEARQQISGPAKIGIWTKDPKLGWKHIPGAVGRHTTSEFDVEYAIDADGCRAIPAPENSKGEILILGCSYTFGHGVAGNECYSAVLAGKYWKQYTVKNHAVMGWGTPHCYLRLEEILEKSPPPKLVVYAWISHHAARSYRRMSWLKKINVRNRKTPYFEIKSDRLEYRGLVGVDMGLDITPELIAKEIDIATRLIKKMRAACQEKNTPFVFVLLPDPYVDHEINNKMIEVLSKAGVSMIDAWKYREDYFPHDRHPLPSWHSDLARLLAESDVIRAALK